MGKKFVGRQDAGESPRAIEAFNIPKRIFEATSSRPPRGWILETCGKIEGEAGIGMTAAQKQQLWRIVRHFARTAYTEMLRPKAPVARHRIEEVRDASLELHRLLSTLQEENPSSVYALLREKTSEPRVEHFDELTVTLSNLQTTCTTILSNFDYHLVGKPGRSKHPAFEPFIRHLGTFAASFGMKVSAASSPSYVDFPRGTPFVRFCWLVYEAVPPVPGIVQLSKSAFGSAVNEVLRRGKGVAK